MSLKDVYLIKDISIEMQTIRNVKKPYEKQMLRTNCFNCEKKLYELTAWGENALVIHNHFL